MRRIQGINNDRGYTKLRIWLGPKRNRDGTLNKPFVRYFGPYSVVNISRAKIYMDEIREQFRIGKPIKKDPQPILLSKALEIFWHRHWKSDPNRSKKSLSSAYYVLEGFKKAWPTTPLHLMKPKDIEDHMVRRRASGVKDSTIKQQLHLLASMFERMDEYVKREEIEPILLPEFNPVQYAKKPKVSSDMQRQRWASREELRKLKAWCSTYDPDLWRAIEYAILSGLRRGDLMAMQGQAKVQGIQQKTGNIFSLPVDFSKPASMTNYRKRWVRARHEVGMDDFHWHDFRHTHATMLKNVGADQSLIQESLGHSDPRQTDIYTNGRAERLQPWISKLRTELDSIEVA